MTVEEELRKMGFDADIIYAEGYEKGCKRFCESGYPACFEKAYVESYAEEYMIGFALGVKDAMTRLNKLNKLLFEAGRVDDLIKGAKDKEFQDTLLKEFGLDKKTYETV